MSDLRLYVDEDAGEHAVIQGLRARNIDVLTTIEANRLGSDDPSQLVFATSIGRAIYTASIGIANEITRIATNNIDDFKRIKEIEVQQL